MESKRKSYLLRISEDDWDELSRWAAQEFRSVNGQIELIVKRALEEHKRGQKTRPPAVGGGQEE